MSDSEEEKEKKYDLKAAYAEIDRMEISDEDKRVFEIEHIVKTAKSKNVIACCQDKSEKMTLTLLVVKALSPKSQGPDGKKMIILVPDESFVNEHVRNIREWTYLKVKGYTEMPASWKSELQSQQVVILTAKTMLQAFHGDCVSLSQISLILFYDCHYLSDCFCFQPIDDEYKDSDDEYKDSDDEYKDSDHEYKDSDHEYKGVYKFLDMEHFQRYETLRIFGISNSLSTYICPHDVGIHFEKKICKGCTLIPNLFKATEALERKLNGIFITSELEEEIMKISNCMEENEIVHDKFKIPLQVTEKLDRDKLRSESWKLDFFGILENLGPLCLHMAIKLFFPTGSLQEFCEMCDPKQLFTDPIMIPPKINKLLKIIKQVQQYYIRCKDERSKFCIVFIEGPIQALLLYKFLKYLSESDDEFKFLNPGVIIDFTKEDILKKLTSMMVTEDNKILNEDQMKNINFLVAESNVVENLDLPKCCAVISFDFPKSPQQYIRFKRTSYIMYIFFPDENKSVFEGYLTYYHFQEEILINFCETRRNIDFAQSYINLEISLKETFLLANLAFNTAISYLLRYCQNLSYEYGDKLLPIFKTESSPSELSGDDSMKYRKSISYPEFIKQDYMYTSIARIPTKSFAYIEIKGPQMPDRKLAVTAAALCACIKVYNIDLLETEHEVDFPSILFKEYFNESLAQSCHSHEVYSKSHQKSGDPRAVVEALELHETPLDKDEKKNQDIITSEGAENSNLATSDSLSSNISNIEGTDELQLAEKMVQIV